MIFQTEYFLVRVFRKSDAVEYAECRVGRLVAIAHSQNLASKKLLASLGYKYEVEVIHYGIRQELYFK